MPSAYTSIVEDDPSVTFRTFALRCARAFLFHQRDEEVVQPPRNQELDGHLEVELEKANIQLDLRLSMTAAQAEAGARAEYAQTKKAVEECEAEWVKRRARFAQLRHDVCAWLPPDNLLNLQSFMLEQLDGELVGTSLSAPKKLSGREWRNEQVKRALAEVERCQEAVRQDAERCRETNAWVAALYASLPPAREP